MSLYAYMRMQAINVDLRPLSRLMKALGDESRLRMIALLSHGELCVCHLESALGLTQWATSRHLAVLRAAGVVDFERRGTWVYYRLAAQPDADRKQVLRSVLRRCNLRDVFRRDAERLMKTRVPCK